MTEASRTRSARRMAGAVALLLLFAGLTALADAEHNTLPHEHMRYVPSIVPDRIVLVVTENPAHSQTVNWRTNHTVSAAQAQISVATDTPGLHVTARTVVGTTRALLSENGLAHHHAVHFDGLRPDTLYAYRVRGGDTWSEWFQFRTAAEDFAPFSFLYFGDAQNSIKSHFSRVIRAAWRELPGTKLMLHAGDLVNTREGIHDDEWGEWFEAGGFLHAMVANVPVTGNHEFLNQEDTNGEEHYHLSPLWSAQLTVPSNGPKGFEETVYFTEYQDVLLVVLDSTRALQSREALDAQAEWLEQVLAASRHRWRIVSHHHPMYSVGMGRDNPELRDHWQPLYERYGVDLVLQGHDHAYGRGENVAGGATVLTGNLGPVYVVSVAGPKMYLVDDHARSTLKRVGEDTQLYQIVHIESDRLRFESRTVTGRIYDAFDIERLEDGTRRLIERMPEGSGERVCSNPDRPRATRCWNGVELVGPPP